MKDHGANHLYQNTAFSMRNKAIFVTNLTAAKNTTPPVRTLGTAEMKAGHDDQVNYNYLIRVHFILQANVSSFGFKITVYLRCSSLSIYVSTKQKKL